MLELAIRRVLTAACIVVALVAISVAVPRSAFAASGPQPGRRVVIVLAPYLAWSDISPTSTPSLWSLARGGAIGNMNTQVGGYDGASVEDGALTLSAANWAHVSPRTPAPYDRTEVTPGSSSTAPPRGAASDSGAIKYPGFRAAEALNQTALAPAAIGTLGQNVHFMGARTAAVGNSDELGPTSAGPLHRPAALAAMDDQGFVDVGTLSVMLNMRDPAAPYGVRTNPVRLFAAVKDALAAVASTSAAGSLTVVDPGDLLRAHDAGQGAPSKAWRDAVTLLDATVAQVRNDAPDATVIVLAPVEQRDFWSRPALGPIIIGGADSRFRATSGPGLLTSPTTKRAGLVSNLDVASTVLQLVAGDSGGAVAPLGNGSVMGVRSGTLGTNTDPDTLLSDRVRALSSAGTAFVAIDSVQGSLVSLWILLAIMALGLSLLSALGGVVRLRGVAQVALILVGSVPAGSVIASWLPRFPPTAAWYVVSLAAWTVAVFLVAMGMRQLSGWGTAPMAYVAALTALVVVAGQLFGAHGPYGESTLFGYSVLTGWRYYGAGNEISAIAVACVLLAAGMIAPARWRFVALAGAGGLTVVVLALPGAQAGVAVWGSAGVLFACAAAAPGGLRPRNVAAAIALAVLAAVALIAVDALTGGTHIARLVSATASHGSATLLLTVQRKAIDAWNFSRMTPYSILAIVAALALAWLRWGRRELLSRVLRGEAGLSAALVGALVAGGVALVTEDSGSSMPALLWGFAAMAALYGALALPSADGASGTMAQPASTSEDG